METNLSKINETVVNETYIKDICSPNDYKNRGLEEDGISIIVKDTGYNDSTKREYSIIYKDNISIDNIIEFVQDEKFKSQIGSANIRIGKCVVVSILKKIIRLEKIDTIL